MPCTAMLLSLPTDTRRSAWTRWRAGCAGTKRTDRHSRFAGTSWNGCNGCNGSRGCKGTIGRAGLTRFAVICTILRAWTKRSQSESGSASNWCNVWSCSANCQFQANQVFTGWSIFPHMRLVNKRCRCNLHVLGIKWRKNSFYELYTGNSAGIAC